MVSSDITVLMRAQMLRLLDSTENNLLGPGKQATGANERWPGCRRGTDTHYCQARSPLSSIAGNQLAITRPRRQRNFGIAPHDETTTPADTTGFPRRRGITDTRLGMDTCDFLAARGCQQHQLD